MKRSIAHGVATATLAAALSGWNPGAPRAQSAEDKPFAVQYLDSLGGNLSRGNSINNEGWIAGFSNLPGNIYRHAALWRGDTLIDLGALGNPTKSKNSVVAWGVKNTRGLVVGISQTDSPDPWGEDWSCAAFFVSGTSTGYRCIGFAWENGVMRPLPTLGGTHGYAAAANNLGQIVGWAETTTRDPDTCTPPQLFQFRAVVWGPDGNTIHELPLMPGDNSSAATAINGQGQVVGISGVCDEAVGSATAKHAVLWENGTVTDIGNLGGDEWNTPTAINERGDIVGFSDHAGDLVTEAFLWTRADGLKSLGWLDGHGHSEAYGINNRGDVAGLSCTADFSECRAVVWLDGVIHDLNDLADVGEGELLRHARDINDDRVVTGLARRADGTQVAFAATPTGASLSSVSAEHVNRGAAPSVTREDLRLVLHPLSPGVKRTR